MTAEHIALGLGLKRTGREYRGACPIHGGSSFTVTEKAGKPVFYCWSGCDRGAILQELKARGLWPASNWTPEQKRDFAAQRQRDERDLIDARLFADAAAILAEQTLEDLGPCDLQRGIFTRLLMALRAEAGMLAEFRTWRDRDAKLARALVQAGAGHIHRLEMLTAYYLIDGGAHAC